MRSEQRERVARVGLRWRDAVCVGLGVLLTAMMAGEALGQQVDESGSFDLVGTVVDEAGKPLVGAFVTFEGERWGSLSNDAGRFLLPDVAAGTVTLTAELLGYETLTWTGSARAGEAVRLALAAQPILLEGLTVVTDRFENRRRGSATTVRWFDQGDLATSPQTNVIDFVATRAGLTRLRCQSVFSTECFVVRGRTVEPTIWIDEAPVIGGMDYLLTVRPHELYMVEVYARGRHIRAYTHEFMERAAKTRLQPVAFVLQ